METESLFVKFKELYKERSLHDCQNKFIRDGIIDPIFFSSQQTKILFIAKEHNHLGNPIENPDEDDYRKWWNYHVHLQFSHRISEWAYGILNGFPEGIEQLRYDQKHLALRSIAFINVKKASGNSKADSNVICHYISESRNLLHQQIEMISPTLIICCLRQDYYIESLFQLKMNTVETGIFSYGNWEGVPVINFYHPSSRKKKLFLYQQLQEAVNHIKCMDGQ
ncbi:hypothetical protein [Spirosoma agri]|uniref:Uracil-DNA glycosylase n=1 Tax=Spirosoma agri TaxID=1987381 RepID=A0A6M0ICH1_9BACT|nr:hypothetical protein [Spirosoma agri]NEU65946.1 hypothetical protein [Spirosoma agri]